MDKASTSQKASYFYVIFNGQTNYVLQVKVCSPTVTSEYRAILMLFANVGIYCASAPALGLES
jgi:hypothetical protein